MTSFFAQVCKIGYHLKACGIGNAMKATANRLLNYTGHGGPKNKFRGQKSKIVSENRNIIFRSKLMPISVMIGPIEPEKLGRFSGTDFFYFLLHSVIGLLGQHKSLRPNGALLYIKRAFVYPKLKGPFVSIKGPLVSIKGPFVGFKEPFSGQDRDLSGQHGDLLSRTRVLTDRKKTFSSRQGPSQVGKGPPEPTQGSLRAIEGLLIPKDFLCKLTEDHLIPTNGPLPSWECTRTHWSCTFRCWGCTCSPKSIKISTPEQSLPAW